MATIKGYRVKRAGFAPLKGGGSVHITRHNQEQIPRLLSKVDIKARVDSGAFEEYDTGITTEDVEATELLEAKAGLKPKKRKG